MDFLKLNTTAPFVKTFSKTDPLHVSSWLTNCLESFALFIFENYDHFLYMEGDVLDLMVANYLTSLSVQQKLLLYTKETQTYTPAGFIPHYYTRSNITLFVHLPWESEISDDPRCLLFLIASLFILHIFVTFRAMTHFLLTIQSFINKQLWLMGLWALHSFDLWDSCLKQKMARISSAVWSYRRMAKPRFWCS